MVVDRPGNDQWTLAPSRRTTKGKPKLTESHENTDQSPSRPLMILLFEMLRLIDNPKHCDAEIPGGQNMFPV